MIIFISGPINSGKTTISNILERKIPNTAVIEVDSIRSMVKWMPLFKALSLDLKNTISLIKNFVEKDMNVIVSYPIRKKDYKYIIKNLNNINSKIYFFTLSPKIEFAIKNRGDREILDYQVKKIKHHYSIGIANPNFGEIIDNTYQTAEETANKILSKINLKKY